MLFSSNLFPLNIIDSCYIYTTFWHTFDTDDRSAYALFKQSFTPEYHHELITYIPHFGNHYILMTPLHVLMSRTANFSENQSYIPVYHTPHTYTYMMGIKY